MNVVLNRTISVDGDWRSDNLLSSSHLQSQSELYQVSKSRQLMVLYSGYWLDWSIASRCYWSIITIDGSSIQILKRFLPCSYFIICICIKRIINVDEFLATLEFPNIKISGMACETPTVCSLLRHCFLALVDNIALWVLIMRPRDRNIVNDRQTAGKG